MNAIDFKHILFTVHHNCSPFNFNVQKIRYHMTRNHIFIWLRFSTCLSDGPMDGQFELFRVVAEGFTQKSPEVDVFNIARSFIWSPDISRLGEDLYLMASAMRALDNSRQIFTQIIDAALEHYDAFTVITYHTKDETEKFIEQYYRGIKLCSASIVPQTSHRPKSIQQCVD